MKKLKKIPKFKSEEAEQKFWGKNDVTDFFDTSKAVKVKLAKLRPTIKTISIRLPESLIEEIKLIANKQDVPYQSMLKILLSEKVREVDASGQL